MTEKLEALKVNVMLLDNCLESWQAINWRQVHRRVSRLRKRIYRASVERELNKVRKLQRLMMRSTANKLLAIYQVTQIHLYLEGCLIRSSKKTQPTFLNTWKKATHKLSTRTLP